MDGAAAASTGIAAACEPHLLADHELAGRDLAGQIEWQLEQVGVGGAAQQHLLSEQLEAHQLEVLDAVPRDHRPRRDSIRAHEDRPKQVLRALVLLDDLERGATLDGVVHEGDVLFLGHRAIRLAQAVDRFEVALGDEDHHGGRLLDV
eukprot:scaffold64847_cov51-Phaeocystis_antarctica.AAC.1